MEDAQPLGIYSELIYGGKQWTVMSYIMLGYATSVKEQGSYREGMRCLSYHRSC